MLRILRICPIHKVSDFKYSPVPVIVLRQDESQTLLSGLCGLYAQAMITFLERNYI